MKHLIWALLCVGCGGSEFNADEREATADGGNLEMSGKPTGGAGGSAPLIEGSGGTAGASDGSTGGSGAADAGGSPEGGSGGSDVGDAGGTGGSGGSGGGDACATGATRCSDTQTEVCANGEWFPSVGTCPNSTPVCLDGRCVECTPGTEQCASPTQPGICDATGSWASSGDACTGTTPQCLSNECSACATAAYCPECSPLSKCCRENPAFPGAIGSCGCFTGTGCF